MSTKPQGRRNCILPTQFYAMMKSTYAGGQSFPVQSHTGTGDHAASAGVVFPGLSRGNCPGEPGCLPCIRLDRAGRRFLSSAYCRTDPVPADDDLSRDPVAITLRPALCILPGGGALSDFCP